MVSATVQPCNTPVGVAHIQATAYHPVVAVRDEVQRQRESDKNWPTHSPEVLLVTRIRALSEARRKAAEGDPDAVHAMRQSLLDIAAAASRAADDLPPPPPLDS